MKKIISGVFAAVLAIGFSAFTAPVKKATLNYYFEFDYTAYSPTKANVEGSAAWKISTSTSCPNAADEKACKIEVDAAKTHLESGVRKINPGTNIVATEFLPNN